ncbi:hypothetical protein [Leadbettera azotonutricia]|uniref:Uncharacterized protein n=1 Tax=Leadbettera azotonutricia (strain ATCC BAA-888 / DSM 13862 / ZAS-9) TaxID=545695 RepID=F5YAZ6_LEAAZ|nr:hypothetical protein [Leadbettera azotonutricia]AEF80258.1 conserved hypothetical protein [Leadbettera azotonutricia ZAS-9]
MNRQINFEDNIYITLVRIKLIRDLFALDTDPGLFLDKTLEDIDFIDATLQALQAQMQERLRFIEREELLNHLAELELQFSQALSEFLNSKGTVSAQEFPAIRDKITILRTRSLDRRKTSENAAVSIADFSEGPAVSSDELNELLKDF